MFSNSDRTNKSQNSTNAWCPDLNTFFHTVKEKHLVLLWMPSGVSVYSSFSVTKLFSVILLIRVKTVLLKCASNANNTNQKTSLTALCCALTVTISWLSSVSTFQHMHTTLHTTLFTASRALDTLTQFGSQNNVTFSAYNNTSFINTTHESLAADSKSLKEMKSNGNINLQQRFMIFCLCSLIRESGSIACTPIANWSVNISILFC